MRLVLFLAVWGWGEGGEGRSGRSWARVWGAVCDLAAVPAREGLSAGCSAFHLLTGGGASGLAFTPLPGADAHLGHTWNRGGAWYPGEVCLCPCILAQLGTAGSLLGELGLGWAQTLGVRCCGGLWLLVSLCSPPPPPLYPPEKTSALHAALLPAHCASWQTHNLTFLGLI